MNYLSLSINYILNHHLNINFIRPLEEFVNLKGNIIDIFGLTLHSSKNIFRQTLRLVIPIIGDKKNIDKTHLLMQNIASC